MDEATIRRLNAINRRFYAITAREFDQTRGQAWPGWSRLAQYLTAPLSVLDVGCGNGRFGRFLAQRLDGPITYHGLDNNPALLALAEEALADLTNVSATLTEQDIIEKQPQTGEYDLVALFGVLHHVPGQQNRTGFLRSLAQRVAPGGLLCFASWRFYEYERFQERIAPWPDDIRVERHDYLLDWRRGQRALRYCHYVDDAEQAALVRATGLTEVCTFRADGCDNRMNCYSIVRKEI